jgi:hypothetical protein
LTLTWSANSVPSKASMPTTAPVFGRAAALTRMSTPPSPAATAPRAASSHCLRGLPPASTVTTLLG